MGEPNTIHAGSTVVWTRTLPSDYPPLAGWTAEYILFSPDAKITISGAVVVASGSLQTITIPASTTANYVPGQYTWDFYAVKSPLRYRLDGGVVRIAPNVVDLEAEDHRSHTKKTLDAIEALIEGRSVDGIEGMSVRGRSIQLMSITDLVVLRSTYQQLYRTEVDAQRVSSGLTSRRKIRVRFT